MVSKLRELVKDVPPYSCGQSQDLPLPSVLRNLKGTPPTAASSLTNSLRTLSTGLTVVHLVYCFFWRNNMNRVTYIHTYVYYILEDIFDAYWHLNIDGTCGIYKGEQA